MVPGLVIETLFAGNCKPTTSDIPARQLILLREEGELFIVGENGAQKLRAKAVSWSDRVVLPASGRCFRAFG
jgi:hypothetical protein